MNSNVPFLIKAFFMIGLFYRVVNTAGETSCLHYLPSCFSSICFHSYRGNSTSPHASIVFTKNTTPPHSLCPKSLRMLFVVYFAYVVCIGCVCVHAHHPGHKVSLVHGTWVLWFASSSLWSARWSPWPSRENSTESCSQSCLSCVSASIVEIYIFITTDVPIYVEHMNSNWLTPAGWARSASPHSYHPLLSKTKHKTRETFTA